VSSPVCINEFLAGSQGGEPDWVELYNRGGATIDLAGWHLSDTLQNLTRYTFPAGSTVAPQGFLSVDEVALGFGIDANGSEILVLTHSNGTARDYVDCGPQAPDVSQGRLEDGTSNWYFFGVPSRDAPNACTPGSAPGVVTGLVLASKSALTWQASSGAQHYDVVKGSLAVLRQGGGSYAAAITGCVENNGADTAAWDAGTPPAGQGTFYLVRGADFSCGTGSFDTASSHQVGARDPGIALAPAACP
jgi:hypothetical protein